MPDPGDIHGGLLALTELAAAFRDSAHHEELAVARRKVSRLNLIYQGYDHVSDICRFHRYSRLFPMFLSR